MLRQIRHRHTENKRLYDYNSLAVMSDCPERIVCLSERSFQIILKSMNKTEEMRSRVFTSQQEDFYTIATTDQFELFQQWVNDTYNQLGEWPMCNEKLERIAVALEAMVENQDAQTVNLDDLLEVLGLDPSEHQRDLIEAFQYLRSIFPALPQIAFPWAAIFGWIGSWRQNGAILNLLEDISISQRGQAIAQGGVDFAAIYDDLGDTPERLLLKGGYVGYAAYIWNRLKPRDVPNWIGWLGYISTTFLGSIRGATYDVAEAIENLDLGQIAEAINNQTIACNTSTTNCAPSQVFLLIEDNASQGNYAFVQNDSLWSGTTTGSPPVSDDAEWEAPSLPDYKCQASNFIVGWMAAFYGRSEWSLTETDTVFTLADKIKRILAEIPSIGATLNGMSRLIGRLLNYLASGDTTIFVTVNEVLTDLKDELVCALYLAENASSAREAFLNIISEDGRLDSLSYEFLDVFLTSNNVMGLLWYSNPEVEAEIAFYGDDCSCGVALFGINGFNPNVTILSGNFQEGEETEVRSGVRNYYGSDRAGMNLHTLPGGETSGPNRRVRVASVNWSGSNPYIVLVVSGVPDGGGTEYSVAALEALDEEINGIQITHAAVGDTATFDVTFIVEELP